MEQFVGSDLVLLTLTVGFYCLGSALYSRTKFALLHPVLLGFVAMILYLKLFGIPLIAQAFQVELEKRQKSGDVVFELTGAFCQSQC